MKKSDDIIKEALLKKILRIDDDSFTENIVQDYLSRKPKVKYAPFNNFIYFIIGISLVCTSIGLFIFAWKSIPVLDIVMLNESQGLLLLVLSIIFLILKVLEEITIPYKPVIKS